MILCDLVGKNKPLQPLQQELLVLDMTSVPSKMFHPLNMVCPLGQIFEK